MNTVLIRLDYYQLSRPQQLKKDESYRYGN